MKVDEVGLAVTAGEWSVVLEALLETLGPINALLAAEAMLSREPGDANEIIQSTH